VYRRSSTLHITEGCSVSRRNGRSHSHRSRQSYDLNGCAVSYPPVPLQRGICRLGAEFDQTRRRLPAYFGWGDRRVCWRKPFRRTSMTGSRAPTMPADFNTNRSSAVKLRADNATHPGTHTLFAPMNGLPSRPNFMGRTVVEAVCQTASKRRPQAVTGMSVTTRRDAHPQIRRLVIASAAKRSWCAAARLHLRSITGLAPDLLSAALQGDAKALLTSRITQMRLPSPGRSNLPRALQMGRTFKRKAHGDRAKSMGYGRKAPKCLLAAPTPPAHR